MEKEWILAGIAVIGVVLLIGMILLQNQIRQLKNQLKAQQELNSSQKKEISDLISQSFQTFSGTFNESQRNSSEYQRSQLQDMRQLMFQQFNVQENRFKTFEAQSIEQLDRMRTTMILQLDQMKEENRSQLEQMRETVDEKLQKTLEDRMTQSFKLVSERLEQVYKGLGEMQSLAVGVGDLKKVLSNVKTRGIVGEIQLGAILEQILSKEQYGTNVKVIPGKNTVVEYAIRLPGEDDQPVWLPIDSKFPADVYAHLQDAYDTADPQQIQLAVSELTSRMKSFAKDIHDKYIEPPYTTDFAILFVPFEGLYAEVVNRGLVEVLQRDYHINIAGPSTMAALLNSLQMGFRTLAVQKRSSEVWTILGAVKTEFDKFQDVLVATQTRLDQANRELDKLVGVRTRVIQRKLKEVQQLQPEQSRKLLELDEE